MSETENVNKPKNGGARPGAGRPKSEATIKAQIARSIIAERLQESLTPIISKAIVDAIDGDDKARSWLSDQAWGKPLQRSSLEDDEGNPLTIMIPVPVAQAFNLHATNTDSETGGVSTK